VGSWVRTRWPARSEAVDMVSDGFCNGGLGSIYAGVLLVRIMIALFVWPQECLSHCNELGSRRPVVTHITSRLRSNLFSFLKGDGKWFECLTCWGPKFFSLRADYGSHYRTYHPIYISCEFAQETYGEAWLPIKQLLHSQLWNRVFISRYTTDRSTANPKDLQCTGILPYYSNRV
jgi:hypothetical protein